MRFPRPDCSSCIAISGLGGHAFTSFEEREGNFMWLRDALPLDLKGAQIWIYGYDTSLVNSTSYQDLEALASTFRRIWVSSRIKYSVRGFHGSQHILLLVSSDILQRLTGKSSPFVFIAHSLGGLILKEVTIARHPWSRKILRLSLKGRCRP